MDKFEIELGVRDYELDVQGIVNNAIYNNYYEHTRHSFLKKCGLNFFEMHENGEDAVVIKSEIEYKAPLRSNDKFVCTLTAEAEGRLKIIFLQEILKLPERKLMNKAKFTVALVKNGRPIEPDYIREKMQIEL